jgi:hypothetical protein
MRAPRLDEDGRLKSKISVTAPSDRCVFILEFA